MREQIPLLVLASSGEFLPARGTRTAEKWLHRVKHTSHDRERCGSARAQETFNEETRIIKLQVSVHLAEVEDMERR